MEPFGRIVWVPAGAASLFGEYSVPEGGGSTVVLIARALGLDQPLEAEHELAKDLAGAGHATLILDLVEPGEKDRIESVRSDPGLLPNRLIAAAWWLLREQSLYEPVLGLVGMPTAAGAALEAAASISDVVKALVVLGGRPSLPRELLAKVEAPTLLVSSAQDAEELVAYHEILSALDVEKQLERIPGVGEELKSPIEWAHIATHTTRWISRYLTPAARGVHTSHVHGRETGV